MINSPERQSIKSSPENSLVQTDKEVEQIEKTELTQNEKRIFLKMLLKPSTLPEEAESICRHLFPQKEETLANADKDREGRPVRYFRLMDSNELLSILNIDEFESKRQNQEKEEFNRKAKEIEYSLKGFLRKEGLDKILETDFLELCSNFTLENYQNFVLSKLPKIKLLKLHKIGAYLDGTNATSLKSLSVGIPFQLPTTSMDEKWNQIVVEFSIPSSEVIVYPDRNLPLDDKEKEINTRSIKPEWIIDVYVNVHDISQRLFNDPKYLAYNEYQIQGDFDTTYKFGDYIGESGLTKLLFKLKDDMPIENLIPVQKISDLDGTNPELQKPLLKQS
jgi:hypothetical protein